MVGRSPITMTTSPRPSISPADAAAASVPRVPRRISSWSFVSSRQTAAGRPSPQTDARSASVPASRPGASKRTAVRSSEASRATRSRRSRPRRGRNPSKLQRGPAIPAATSAARTADAPGIGTTVPPSAAHAATSAAPGSETSGVPASVTRARSRPDRRCPRSVGRVAALFRAWCGTRWVVMPWRAKSRRVIRVSSAATSGTARSVSIARSVTSPRLPIGVATTYRRAARPAGSAWRPTFPPSSVAAVISPRRPVRRSGLMAESSAAGDADRGSRCRASGDRAWRPAAPGA